MRLLVLGSGGMLGRAVVRDARRLGHDVVALARMPTSTSPTPTASRDASPPPPRAPSSTARRFTDVDGAEADEGRATARQRRRRRATSRGPPPRRARASCTSRPTTSSTAPSGEPWLESDPVAPLQAYGRTKLAGERAVADAGPPSTRSSARRGCSAPAARTSSRRCCASARERDEVTVVTDQRGGPTWTGHLAAALVEVAEREGDVGLFHAAGTASARGTSSPSRSSTAPDCAAASCPTTSRALRAPARRPAYSVLGTEREPADRPAAVAGRPRRLPRRAAGTGAAAA